MFSRLHIFAYYRIPEICRKSKTSKIFADAKYAEGVRKEVHTQNLKSIMCTCGRMRVRLARLRNEDEDSVHKLYTLVTYVNVPKVIMTFP